MAFLKSVGRFAKRIGLVSLAALSLNAVFGHDIQIEVKNKKAKLEQRLEQAESCDHPKLKTAARELANIGELNYNPFRPFWNVLKVDQQLDERLQALSSMPKECAKREIDIGFANEGQDKEKFISALDEANWQLVKHGIYANLKESVNVKTPTLFDNDTFEYGIKHSFSQPLDYYFAWSTRDFRIMLKHFGMVLNGNGIDYLVKGLTQDRVCLIDNPFPHHFSERGLDQLIAQEILRLFANEENELSLRIFNDEILFDKVDEAEVRKNLRKQFKNPNYQLIVNLKERREVTVNVALDGVSKEYAQKLLSFVSDIYEGQFNITFNPMGFYKHELPDRWNFVREMRKMKDAAKNPSDIYLLLTGTDWTEFGYFLIKNSSHNSSAVGQTNPKAGAIWVETYQEPMTTIYSLVRGTREVVQTLTHEIGHLFGIKHIYLRGSIMHPYSSDSFIWTPKSKETILMNKKCQWGKGN